MTLASASRLGPFEIIAPLGAGGMGEVYRARDTRLGRDVAVKILPASFSTDSDRLRRFEQEACAAGALNHPNILIVHDIGTHDGSPYVVSELLEGETLRQRLSRAALAQRRGIDYALQIARGRRPRMSRIRCSGGSITTTLHPTANALIVATVGEGGSAPMNLVVNWTADLK